MRGILAGAGLAVMLGTGLAQAQAPAMSVIDVRQTGYAFMGVAFGDMKRAVEAKADPKPYEKTAEVIARWATVVPSLFPPGSDKGETKALPAIWSDRAGFEKAAADLRAAAIKLASAAKSGDPAAFEAEFKATGAACGACHRAYRAR